MAFILLVCSLALCAAARASAARDPQLQAGYQPLHIAQEERGSILDQQAPSLAWSDIARDGDGASLTLRVLHRDSPLSHLRNSQATRQELLLERLKRDAARVAALSSRAQMAAEGLTSGDLAVETAAFPAQEEAIANFTGPVVSGLKQGSGEYFTRIGVGTPPRQNFMVLDTGSDILWIQCAPCVDCYPQTDPIFNPALSSSFHTLTCASPLCSQVELHGCQSRTNFCQYQVAYGDGSFTTGDFALEALSFRGATMNSVALGCGHDNEGLFAGAAGLLGLGGGPLSFPSQMGGQFGKKFSYCLIDRDRAGFSSLIFGNAAVPRSTVFTPLSKNPKLDTFYYVSLTGISVAGNLLTIPASAFKMDGTGNGGVIIDSGTSVTRLVETAYGPLRSAFRAATSSMPFTGGFSLFDTCYNLSGKASVDVPTVVLHFESAADLALPAANYLIPVDSAGTYCLAFASTGNGLSIIGNIQQQGFRVVFDALFSRLGFASNQC